ncbi:MAG: hypothetical protein H8D97_00410 [Proteobacteria bacterium]|nr:hypothetical protein [Pseudomonadota bacterium]
MHIIINKINTLNKHNEIFNISHNITFSNMIWKFRKKTEPFYSKYTGTTTSRFKIIEVEEVISDVGYDNLKWKLEGILLELI